MPRIVKQPDERRAEIVETADRLFREVGYAKCSVEAIIREIGVAKGTFYYYFKSKPEILEAVVDRTLNKLVEAAEEVAQNPALSAMEKMEALLSGGQIGDGSALDVAEMLHAPENRELHELTNIQTVLRLSPLLARIVEQGNAEGVCSVERPLETIQFLFTGAQFLTDTAVFGFTGDELRIRREVMQTIVEKALGAPPGSFAFLTAPRATT